MIKDTGQPSGKCWITLSKINETDKNYFQQIDFIILEESKNSSTYMSGRKKDGIYYLFINTSNLPPGYYLLHAEVTLSRIKNFELFTSKKYDNLLFYLPSRESDQKTMNLIGY
jgi:hypothetical protein